MSKANRPNVCVSSGKRLRRKSWYYRNGKYYFSQRYFKSDQAKGAEDKAKAAAAEQAKAEPKTA